MREGYEEEDQTRGIEKRGDADGKKGGEDGELLQVLPKPGHVRRGGGRGRRGGSLFLFFYFRFSSLVFEFGFRFWMCVLCFLSLLLLLLSPPPGFYAFSPVYVCTWVWFSVCLFRFFQNPVRYDPEEEEGQDKL